MRTRICFVLLAASFPAMASDEPIITTPHGLATINLKTRAIDPLVEGRVNVIVAGRKTGQVYYAKEGVIYAIDVNTRAIREIAKLAAGSVSTLNADETLLAGTVTEGAG